MRPKAGGHYVDATVGTGGHAEAVLERCPPDGRLLGLDRDPTALARAGERLRGFGERVRLVHDSYANMPRYLDALGWKQVSGMVADLGLCSLQLADPRRGFSFSLEGPLDMRYDLDTSPTARDLVNRLSERELADLIFQYGEERRSRAIARRIVSRRPLATTTDLRRAIVAAMGPRRRGRIDPATRTFQALRIAVNRETDALATFLTKGVDRLEPAGRAVVISYHSLEDRAVKHTFRQKAGSDTGPRFRIITAKPVLPSEQEIRRNRRARSAKLRVLERTS